jgi:hypothetical protein
MSGCAPAFSKEISLSCLIDFVKAVRLGPSPSVVKQGLWLAGSLMEKFIPDDTVSVQSTVEFTDLESALDTFESVIASASSPDVTATALPWAALIPIILEIIRLISKG